MAIGSASGYNNLQQGNFVPEIYSQDVLKFLRTKSVADDITNNDWYGEINDFGDTVRILKEPVVSVQAYSRGQELATQDLDDDEFTLTVDKSNYFQFAVNDIEAKQSHVNWESMSTSSAAYALQNAYDIDVLAYMSGQAGSTTGTTVAPIDIGFDTSEVDPLNFMAQQARILDENNVQYENRWFVAGPKFWEQMKQVSSKLIDVEFTGDSSSILRNGMVTKGLVHGFRCYQSNNLVKSGTTYEDVLCGHSSAVATASQIAKTEVIRSESTFADKVRGLHVYGRGIIRPEALNRGIVKFD